jgi:hypothetical protein
MNVKSSHMCIALAVLAATVQFAFVMESDRDQAFQVPVVDAATYHRQAMALAVGGQQETRPFWQPPLYPYALSLLYRAGITGMPVVRCIHALLGVAAVMLTYLIASRGGPWIGFAAGLGVCCYAPLLFYFSQLLPAGLGVVLNLCAILLLLRFAEKATWPRAIGLGITVGLATLTVPNSAITGLIVLGWIVWRPADSRTQRQWPETLRLASSFVAGLLLAILPVTARNYAVSGEFVPISTNGGINLYIGNNPHTDETLTIQPGIDWDRLAALPYREGAKTASAAQRFFLRKVGEFVRQTPLSFAKGLAVKLEQTFSSREIPRNEDLYEFAKHSGILHCLIWRIGSLAFPFGIVGPLALLGVVTMAWRRKDRRILLLFASGYIATVILVFPASRYLAPVMPVFVIFAVLGVQRLCQQASLPIAGRIASVGALALFAVLINLPHQWPTDRVNYAAELDTNVGVGLQTRGRLEESIAEYRAAIELQPDSADAHRFLGTAYRATGRTALAAEEFERAIALRPDHDPALQDLAVARFQDGRVGESVELLRRVLALNPENRQAMINLGVGLLKLKRNDEAAQWFRKARVEVPSGGKPALGAQFEKAN